MRLKSFYAKTMTEAMQMVKDTLGEDAVIVATREEKNGKAVHVTAAIEQPDRYEEQSQSLYNTDGDDRDHVNYGDRWTNENDVDGEDAVIEKLTDVMLRHAVPEEITDQVISCASVIGIEQPEVSLTAALEHLYAFRPMHSTSKSKKATMLVGPPGSGKTLIAAKLAARSTMNEKKIAVISTDIVRAGGIEQLQAFTKLMDVPLQKAASSKDLRAKIEAARGADEIYIDTAGMNPFDPEDMRRLARLIGAGNIEPVLVMPAGIDAEESGEIARIYGTLGVHYMMPSRMDIARRLGGLLSAAHYGGLFFADASNTAKVADGLMTLSPEKLTALLMPEAFRNKPGTNSADKNATDKKTVNAG